MEYLKNKIGKDEFEILKNFKPRDGFQFIEEDDFERVFKYFGEYEMYKNLVPILTDNNSNYSCLYVGGPLKGTVCHYRYDGQNTEPRFKNITRFIDTINKYHDACDFYDLDDLEVHFLGYLKLGYFGFENDDYRYISPDLKLDGPIFDYPRIGNEIDLDNREEIINELLNEFQQVSELKEIPESKQGLREELAFRIMALVKTDEIETYIYPFLDDENMYIQERAIELIGFHRYEPARNKLIELTKTGTINGKPKAQLMLKKWKKQKIQ